jgi:hypothetical protein
MLQKGDRFIHYGRHKTIKGVVEKVVEGTTFDLIHGVKTEKLTIVSETGERFDHNKCRKIVGDLMPKFIRKIRQLT